MQVPALAYRQKEATGFLLMGTVLAYFDLSLYLHMMFVLNDWFFPKSDPHTASFLSAFVFCSTWFLRPLGAFLFGWVGDCWGRKAVVVITTTMMSLSCIAMVILPTYAQIGIAAAWGITLCRMVQGLTSLGERLGSEVYLTELTPIATRYTTVALVAGAAALGNVLALTVASFYVSSSFNWRYAFLVGGTIAIVGILARTRLKETPDFTAAMVRKKQNQLRPDDTKTHWKTYLSYFAIDSVRPFYFYFVFIYTAYILKNDFNMDDIAIIHQNWMASFVSFAQVMGLVALTTRFHPMRILGWCRYSGFLITLALPSLLYLASSSTDILIVQVLCLIFRPDYTPGEGFLCSHIPILRRLTSMSLINAASRVVMYPLITFGLVLITDKLGHYGLWIVALPLCIGYAWGVRHFRRIAKREQMAEEEAPSIPAANDPYEVRISPYAESCH